MSDWTVSNSTTRETYDVIVAGGGPAGCAAAIAAARRGAKTLLVEATGALGGAAAGARVPAWCPFSDGEKIIYRGIALEILNASKEGLPHVPAEMVDWVPIDAEKLKRVYDEKVCQSGAHTLFNTLLCGVRAKGGKIEEVLAANKEGLSVLRGKVFVDCTGDADLAAWAHAPCEVGGQGGETQPGTLCFIIANIDEQAYLNGTRLHASNPDCPIHKILACGRYPEITDDHFCVSLVGPGTLGFNAGHVWNADNTRPETASRALMEGRKMADAYLRGLKEFYPQVFRNAFLAHTAEVFGVRETRRIAGDYTLTAADYFARRSFADDIARNCYFIDIHHTQEEAARQNRIDVEARMERYRPGESHGIPYRCLLPQNLSNAIVAGRSISCDHVVQASIRVMPCCLATGEAAGAAAAAALKTQNDFRKVDTARLQDDLRARGAWIPPQ